jgi:hypothetical protein
MTYCINTAMNAVKASSGDAVRDCTRAEACSYQLRSGDHAVLTHCNRGDSRVATGFVAFVRHIRRNATNAPISPPSSPVFIAPPAACPDFAP